MQNIENVVCIIDDIKGKHQSSNSGINHLNNTSKLAPIIRREGGEVPIVREEKHDEAS